jgi:hypothetical protein
MTDCFAALSIKNHGHLSVNIRAIRG